MLMSHDNYVTGHSFIMKLKFFIHSQHINMSHFYLNKVSRRHLCSDVARRPRASCVLDAQPLRWRGAAAGRYARAAAAVS